VARERWTHLYCVRSQSAFGTRLLSLVNADVGNVKPDARRSRRCPPVRHADFRPAKPRRDPDYAAYRQPDEQTAPSKRVYGRRRLNSGKRAGANPSVSV
jgi:hypothetical protein